LTVFVSSDPSYSDQHLVANAASRVVNTAFGSQGTHARSAVGMAVLPFNMAVEIEGIFSFTV
jgi:enamine deaminase RidA (YjgF/YER057c/UK114 family)